MTREELKQYLKDHDYPSTKSFAKSKKSHKEFKESLYFETEFMDPDSPLALRLYCLVNDVYEYPKCKYCSRDIKRFHKNRDINSKKYNSLLFYEFCTRQCVVDSGQYIERRTKTVQNRYGVDNVMQSEEVKQTVKNTNLDRYGTEWYTSSDSFKIKYVKAMQDKYGVDNISQYDGTKIHKRNMSLLNYGVDNPAKAEVVKYKTKKTNLIRYGAECVFGSDIIKDKIKNTNIELYGVPYPMQNKDYFCYRMSTSYKTKQYKLPSGKIINIQGYEDKALDILLKEYTESDILTEYSVPSFRYTLDNKEKVYYPDIFIKSTNTIIEVKSGYTVTRNIDMNREKWKSVILNGYNFKLMVF